MARTGPREPLAEALRLHQAGDLAGARARYEGLLRQQPRDARLLQLLGTLRFQQGDAHAAIALMQRAVGIDPQQPAALSNLGMMLNHTGDPAAALPLLDRAVTLAPDFADAHLNRGAVLHALGRYPAALAAHDRALALQPASATGFCNRASTLRALGDAEAALAACDRALALRPAYAEASYNRGVVLAELDRPDEALAAYDRALALRPAYAEAHGNRGSLLHDLGRLAEAEASLEHAVAADPGYADAHWNLALVRLLRGDFARGWAGYEWRFRALGLPRPPQSGHGPPWRAAGRLDGEELILHAEQGLGDTLQFCRYAPLLAARGARVTLAVQAPLVELLQFTWSHIPVLAAGSPLPAATRHIALASLPLAFDADAAGIPAAPRYLAADPARVAAWGARLGPRTKPRVGLAWSGNPAHRNDRQRSLALDDLLRALPDGIEPVGLQPVVRPTDAGSLAAHPALRNFGPEFRDFADTAAVCQQLDAVVCVDTSVAHLAGALGVPTLVLLPWMPDWRWQLGRTDSPWYPSLRLLRQQARRDWRAALGAVEAALAALLLVAAER